MSYEDNVTCPHDGVILGLDVGSRNIGLAVLTVSTRELLFSKTISIGGAKNSSDDSEICRQLILQFHDLFGYYWRPDYLTIEQNTQTRWQACVGTAALMHWATRGAKINHVSPNTIKATYEGLGRNGHLQNKKDAMALVVDVWGYAGIHVDHEADALLVATYTLDKNELAINS